MEEGRTKRRGGGDIPLIIIKISEEMTTHIPDPPAELEIGKKTRNTTDGSVETTPEKIEETSKVGSIM